MALKPLGDYVVVKLQDPEEKSDGGIFLPVNSRSDKANQRGVVTAIGPGRYNQEGKRLPMSVKVGDRVLLNWGGTEVEFENKKHRVLREDDIISLID